jgi:hypothetical protein
VIIVPTRNFFSFDSLGSPTNDYQVGPFNVSGFGKLLAARVRGSLQGGYTTNTVSGLLISNGIQWGLQWVDHGVTPINILTDSNDPRWLRIGQRESLTVHEVFDNAITSVEIGSLYTITFDWYGQMPMGPNIDFYVSVGVPVIVPSTSTIDGSLEIIQS